jgi:hypothetical protein
MVEILQKHPNEPYQFDDDKQAKALIFELGLAGRFSANPPNVPTGKSCTQAVHYTEYPTHFILAILYAGNPKAEDNGYFVVCLPKSKFSFAQFNTFAGRFLNQGGNTVVGMQGFYGESPDN